MHLTQACEEQAIYSVSTGLLGWSAAHHVKQKTKRYTLTRSFIAIGWWTSVTFRGVLIKTSLDIKIGSRAGTGNFDFSEVASPLVKLLTSLRRLGCFQQPAEWQLKQGHDRLWTIDINVESFKWNTEKEVNWTSWGKELAWKSSYCSHCSSLSPCQPNSINSNAHLLQMDARIMNLMNTLVQPASLEQ